MRTFFPRDPKTLTREERRKALSSLIFLKEKESGEVKGRTCINGAPQRQYIRKEDAASPYDSVFLTGAVDAYQRRDVAFIDLPGAFLHTLTDEKVIMVLRGELCELMCLVEPKLYRKYVCKDKKGHPVLYVELYKSLYGLMRSALLFYRKLRRELEEYGMKMNPYDMCVANKETKNGHQLTVLWHVDDLKISCKSKVEVTKLICYLRNIYGDKMTIKRGGKGKYLGMNLDFTEPGVFQVDMSQYVKEVLDGFSEEIAKTSATPHSDSLFTVKDEDQAVYLPEEQAMQFHRTTAQLLFLSTRARKDIQTAVSFLTTRVKKPDEDDWRKIRKVLEYLNGTIDLKLRVEIKDLRVMRWSARYSRFANHSSTTLVHKESCNQAFSKNRQRLRRHRCCSLHPVDFLVERIGINVYPLLDLVVSRNVTCLFQVKSLVRPQEEVTLSSSMTRTSKKVSSAIRIILPRTKQPCWSIVTIALNDNIATAPQSTNVRRRECMTSHKATRRRNSSTAGEAKAIRTTSGFRLTFSRVSPNDA
eukprot:CCRYP_015328-RA/>CCRYP_015328-RA protein AED:0.38 eAED:0.07 QI:0/0/0/0.66/0.5/0.33/3/0/529